MHLLLPESFDLCYALKLAKNLCSGYVGAEPLTWKAHRTRIVRKLYYTCRRGGGTMYIAEDGGGAGSFVVAFVVVVLIAVIAENLRQWHIVSVIRIEPRIVVVTIIISVRFCVEFGGLLVDVVALQW